MRVSLAALLAGGMVVMLALFSCMRSDAADGQPGAAPGGPAEAAAPVVNAGDSGNPYGQWTRGLPSSPSFFPIAVWLQSPANAARYKAAGFNLYIGLWDGPTAEQMAALKAAGMPVICDQNAYARAHLDDPTFVGWMHGDEPDNAQSLGDGKGYGPPIPPQKIVDEYDAIRAADPTRPVMLNLGQGVAWNGWYGRGVRTDHPEDYPKYIKGCDIVSFDIYPVVSPDKAVAGKLTLVPHGVDQLRKFSKDRKIVWNCIECTHISNVNAIATPHQVKAEVWMSLIHGSMGLIYFVHQFKPTFIEAGLLAEPKMLAAVTATNKQIEALAPVLNSQSLEGAASVTSSAAGVPIDIMVKKQGGATYVFAVAMADAPTTATFDVKGLTGAAKAEVLGEGRTVKVTDGRFSDSFDGWGVHLYRIAAG